MIDCRLPRKEEKSSRSCETRGKRVLNTKQGRERGQKWDYGRDTADKSCQAPEAFREASYMEKDLFNYLRWGSRGRCPSEMEVSTQTPPSIGKKAASLSPHNSLTPNLFFPNDGEEKIQFGTLDFSAMSE